MSSKYSCIPKYSTARKIFLFSVYFSHYFTRLFLLIYVFPLTSLSFFSFSSPTLSFSFTGTFLFEESVSCVVFSSVDAFGSCLSSFLPSSLSEDVLLSCLTDPEVLLSSSSSSSGNQSKLNQ